LGEYYDDAAQFVGAILIQFVHELKLDTVVDGGRVHEDGLFCGSAELGSNDHISLASSKEDKTTHGVKRVSSSERKMLKNFIIIIIIIKTRRLKRQKTTAKKNQAAAKTI
jgi:hypothetical protein